MAGWIRNRRLASCRRDLVDLQSRESSVSAVCTRHDLVNYSKFSHRCSSTSTACRRGAYRDAQFGTLAHASVSAD